MKNEYIKALIKVTQTRQYAQDFRDGKLWMNRLAFFNGLDKKEIGDRNEGRAFSFQYFNCLVNTIDISTLSMPVFCLYAVYGNNRTSMIVQIPEKMLTFGKYAVVITNVSSFFIRLQQAGLEFSPVYYYPVYPDINDIDFRIPFCPEYRKLHEFQYQSELRIIRRRTLLTKGNVEKYEWLSGFEAIDDDHYVAQIQEGLNDITTKILHTESLVFPRSRKIQVSTDWRNVRRQDHIKYINPIFSQGEGKAI